MKNQLKEILREGRVAIGGKTDLENLRPICLLCHTLPEENLRAKATLEKK